MQPTPELWHHVYDQSPIGISFCDINEFFTDANSKFCSILEYNIEELICLSVDDVTHPADRKSNQLMMSRLRKGEIDGYEMLKRYITKTGKVIWVRLTVWPIKEGDKMLCTLKQIQLVNDERHKVEKVGNGNIQVSPTLSLFEFIADNWKSTVTTLVFLISITITAFVQFQIQKYEIAGLKEQQVEYRQQIQNILHSIETTKP